jgi:uncharacterized membrane protein
MVWRRFAIASVAISALLLAALAGSYVWLDSQSGREFCGRADSGF